MCVCVCRDAYPFANEYPSTDNPLNLCSQIDVCKECILWAEQDKRVFLKQALETRLAGL